MVADTDWVAAIYGVLEELGEFTDALVASVGDEGDGALERLYLPHATFDGLGAMAHVLRQHGAPVSVPRRREARPGWLERLRLLWRYARRPPPSPARWRGFDPDWRPQRRDDARPRAVAHALLSPADSRAVADAAEAALVPLNSFLLWTLQRAVDDAVEPGSGAATWLLPVNMRGPIAREPETCNHASFVFADLGGCASPRQAHARVAERFAARAYWGAWDSINLARLIGRRGLRRVARRNARRGNPFRAVGCFSNHGEWLLPPGSAAARRRWFICPPTLRDQPFSAGSLWCDERLSLCLQAHPALTVEVGRAERWMQAWRAQLDDSVRSHVERPRAVGGR